MEIKGYGNKGMEIKGYAKPKHFRIIDCLVTSFIG